MGFTRRPPFPIVEKREGFTTLAGYVVWLIRGYPINPLGFDVRPARQLTCG
jgi:hypothetical protein